MERRKFIIGAGALATGSSAAVGTGAMSVFESGERTVSVNVTDDASSYIALQPSEGPNGVYAGGSPDEVYGGDFEAGDTLELNFAEENAYQAWGGEGVNPKSTYKFDNVFEIGNVAHQLGPVNVWIEDNNLSGVTFYDSGYDSDDRKSLEGESNSVSPNNTQFVPVGVMIEAGENPEDISGTITIHAERVE